MKVIKQGKPPADIVHTVTCDNCTSVLEFNQSESERSDPETVRVTCPVCENTIHDHVGNGVQT